MTRPIQPDEHKPPDPSAGSAETPEGPGGLPGGQ
jgi:hypothetical protein